MMQTPRKFATPKGQTNECVPAGFARDNLRATDRRWVARAGGSDSLGASGAALPARVDEPIRYYHVAPEDLRPEPLDASPSIFRPEPRRRQLSAAPEVLADSSVVWLAKMPEAFRPVELPRLFPRILNRLCSYWTNPPQWDRYLSSLLIDNRDGRRAGFPPKVAAELAKLFSIHEMAEGDEPVAGSANRR